PKIRNGGQSTPHFFCCYVSERAELGFLQLTDFVAWGGAIKLLLLQAINQKIFDSCKIPSGQNFSHHAHFIADLAQFQPPPQPDTVEGDGFIARLGGAKALPKFRAAGHEYVVSFTADIVDVRDTFARVITALCVDLQADDFVASKLTADNMMLAINVPPVRRSRFTAEL
uniref:DUF1336 domain-containing protein n=1 Tax=Macrostomum lignano TaxID=282301 RepID=A0A1I8FVA0_9PLAT